jgi:hypothetical protein
MQNAASIVIDSRKPVYDSGAVVCSWSLLIRRP